MCNVRLHFVCCFLGHELGFKLAVFVSIERNTKAMFAVAMPKKGLAGKHPSVETIESTIACGCACKDVAITPDRESSIKHLCQDMFVARTWVSTIQLNCRVRNKGSKQLLERAVQSAEPMGTRWRCPARCKIDKFAIAIARLLPNANWTSIASSHWRLET